jgi:formiminotetrahydrofolate cyclodeaminase
MGLDLSTRKLAQVSMNLTDFETTPIHQAFEAVKREAQRHGVGIVGSEIVGLVPRRALEITANFYLQLEDFSPAQVLENRLEASLRGDGKTSARFSALVEPFLDAVGQPTVTPGGGSVAALAGALSASLGQMVAGLSLKNGSLAAHAGPLSDAAAEFQSASRTLTAAIDGDAAAFESVIAAHKLPRNTPEETRRRDTAIQRGLAAAIEVPLEVARKAAEVFEKLGQLEPMSGPSMSSDIGVARLMASAAARGALENVSINLESITDAIFATRVRSETLSLTARISESRAGAGRSGV